MRVCVTVTQRVAAESLTLSLWLDSAEEAAAQWAKLHLALSLRKLLFPRCTRQSEIERKRASERNTVICMVATPGHILSYSCRLSYWSVCPDCILARYLIKTRNWHQIYDCPIPIHVQPFWVALPRNCWHLFFCTAFISISLALPLSLIINVESNNFCLFVCSRSTSIRLQFFMRLYWLSGKMSYDRSIVALSLSAHPLEVFYLRLVAQQAFVSGFIQSSKKTHKDRKFKQGK